MTKIYVPNYGELKEFDTLRDACLLLLNDIYEPFMFWLIKLIRHNIQFRDYIRNNGVEALITHLLENVPELASYKQDHPNPYVRERYSLDHIRKAFNEYPIADYYDIQYYNKNDIIKIGGHTFNGLNDIIKSCECRVDTRGHITYTFGHTAIKDIHIAECYEDYKCLTFLFSKTPFDHNFPAYIKGLEINTDHLDINENIPEKLLPIIYSIPGSNYILVATKRKDTILDV